MSDAADRSLPATPRRREAARDQGAAPNAALPAFVAMVTVAVLLLPGWSRTAVPAAGAFMRESLAAAFHGAGHAPLDIARLVPAQVLLPTAAVVLAAAGAGLCVRFLLDGSAWRLARAAPRFSRIDPFAGIGRVVSMGTLRAVLWNGACLAVLACATGFACGPLVAVLRSAEPLLDAERPLSAVRGVLLPVLLAAAAVAAAQWGLARVAFERRLRMTPEEFKEEMRTLEADPRIKLERRRT
jgi:flagellar biosynthesis protein FlhB